MCAQRVYPLTRTRYQEYDTTLDGFRSAWSTAARKLSTGSWLLCIFFAGCWSYRLKLCTITKKGEGSGCMRACVCVCVHVHFMIVRRLWSQKIRRSPQSEQAKFSNKGGFDYQVGGVYQIGQIDNRKHDKKKGQEGKGEQCCCHGSKHAGFNHQIYAF